MGAQDIAAVSPEAQELAGKQNLQMARVRATMKNGAVKDSAFYTSLLPRVGEMLTFDNPDFLDVVCVVKSVTHKLGEGDPAVPDFIVASGYLEVEEA